MTTSGDSLYVPDGDLLVPTARTARPWDTDGQHGAPLAAAVARSFERLAPTPTHHLARVTLDLLRPVPMRPIEVRAGVLRPGRTLTHVHAGIFVDGIEVARAAGVLMRTAAMTFPDEVRSPDLPPGDPDAGDPARTSGIGFNAEGCEMRFTEGGLHLRGPGAGWMRLQVPVIAGEPTTPVMAAVAAADLGNGFSSLLSLRRWRYMSTDLTVNLARPPASEWIGLRATTLLHEGGIGVTQTGLFDQVGRIGTATQTLIVEPI